MGKYMWEYSDVHKSSCEQSVFHVQGEGSLPEVTEVLEVWRRERNNKSGF